MPIARASMLSHRCPLLLACAILLVLLSLPAHAAAAITPPTLRSPAAGADGLTEGAAMTFDWTGSLQGDPTALDRSFFRVEVIKADDLPSGTQSAWPDVEYFVLTEAGAGETTASLGVPPAGTWRWRVCAWGVADATLRNEIEQLAGGCSSSRSFVTVAATTTDHSIGTTSVRTTVHVDGGVNTVTVPRPAAPVSSEPELTSEPVVEELDALFQPLTKHDVTSNGSAVHLGGDANDPFDSTEASSRTGIGGSIMRGFGSTLPLVPIPFWTLALLLACFPIARAWRRSVIGMFDWEDGSVDGFGTGLDTEGDLLSVVHAQYVKDSSTTADSEPDDSVPTSQPEKGRHAA